MSWQQQLARSLRAAASSGRAYSHAALTSCMLSSSALPRTHTAGAAVTAASSRSAASAIASARALHSSGSLPFSVASLLQQSKRNSPPSFPPQTKPQALATSSSGCEAVSEGGEGDAGSGLITDGEDDDETLSRKPRKGARPKKPPDLALAEPFPDEEIVPGSSQADGEHIFFLSKSQRLQRPLSRAAAAHVHHLVQVRESQEGGLPRVRLGKEGLKQAFLASVGDHLRAHGMAKVQVPRSTGLEPGFVAFCLEASQDCIVLGIKGSTITAYRDTSLPRLPSAYADTDMPTAPPQRPASTTTRMHGHTHYEEHVLQQLVQQQDWGPGHAAMFPCSGQEEGALPALKQLDAEEEEVETEEQQQQESRAPYAADRKHPSLMTRREKRRAEKDSIAGQGQPTKLKLNLGRIIL